MRTLNQRYAVACGLLAIVAPLTFYLNHTVPEPSDMKAIARAIPRGLGKWSALGPDRGGTKEEIEILQTDAIFTRTYQCGTLLTCDLSIVSAYDNPNAIHPPELCYTGAGWTETIKDTVTVPIGGHEVTLNRRLFVRGERIRMWVLYLYKAGPKMTHSYHGFQLAALKARLLRSGCSCSLIQVRAEFDRPDFQGEVLAELRKFASQALPAVDAAIP